MQWRSWLLLFIVLVAVQSAAVRADPPPLHVVAVQPVEAILRTGPNDDFDRLTPQLAGTHLVVVRESGDWYGVQLGPNRTGWIKKADVADLPPDTPAPAAQLKNIDCSPTEDSVHVDLETGDPVAVEVRNLETPARLQVTLANTTLAMFEATQRHGTDLIKSITVDQPEDGVATITLTLRCAHPWGYHLSRSPKGVTLDVRKPPATGIKGAVIMLDPGHGGWDTGAIGRDGLHEADINLQVALALRARLVKAGAHVVMTRETDQAVTPSKADELVARVEAARKARATIFISIHHNARPDVAEGRVTHGTWIYFYHPQSRSLAQAMVEPMAAAEKETNRGHIARSFAVMREPDMPAILCECQFISNPAMEAHMKEPWYVKSVADAMASGVEHYFAQAP